MKDTLPRSVVWCTFSVGGFVLSTTTVEPTATCDYQGYPWVKLYSRPQAQMRDTLTPRSDGRKGAPTDVTLGNIYDVLAENHKFYTIVNDKGNICRYSKARFELMQED